LVVVVPEAEYAFKEGMFDGLKSAGEKMKIPKEINTNCPHCKKHTLHSISLYKKGKERASSWGARRQAGRKRGYGGQKFPELIRTAKTTKKATLKLKCKECNKEAMRKGIRLRKAEIVQ
jgi:large subunit ribosomal protein L44e